MERLRRFVTVRVLTRCRQSRRADEAEPAAGLGRGALHDVDEDVRGQVRAVDLA
jgi:hypothetical protein